MQFLYFNYDRHCSWLLNILYMIRVYRRSLHLFRNSLYYQENQVALVVTSCVQIQRTTGLYKAGIVQTIFNPMHKNFQTILIFKYFF